MEINQLLTPFNRTVKSSRNIKYIVIHYVGATGGAEANCKYYASKYIGASAHYFVGHNGEIWQSVLDKDIAWHCGAKNYRHPEARNSNALGIELCCRNNGQWYFEQETINSAAKLVKSLMSKYNVPIDRVIRHYDVTGKICPAPMVNSDSMWNDFKNALNGGSVQPLPPTPQPTPLLKVGSRGEEVKQLQQNLNVLGYNAGTVDGIFGANTKNAVIKYQRANGLGVDGIVGIQTKTSIEESVKNKPEENIVTRLQKEINLQFGKGLVVDGIFGPSTLEACPTVRKGARGNITRIIQEHLRDRHNCFEGNVDGIFGDNTVKWVKDFQAYFKLTQDGIVGKQTWDKLF